MNKLITTVVLTTFTAVCSFGAIAADTSDTTRSAKEKKWEKEYGDKGTGTASTSEVMENKEYKDIPADEKYKFRDQEVMDTKSHKKDK